MLRCETQNLLQRKSEFKNAHKASATKYNYKPTYSYAEKRMGQKIGFASWNFAILENLGRLKYNAKGRRQIYIRHLQPMLNVKGAFYRKRSEIQQESIEDHELSTYLPMAKNRITPLKNTHGITELQK